MTTEYRDVAEAAQHYLAKGYTHDYHVAGRGLRDVTVGRDLDRVAVRVDASLRFEDGEDGDASNLYAVSDLVHGTKGLVIDAYDVFGSEGPDQLGDHGAGQKLRRGEDDVLMRYGVRKVSRREFGADPERYILRIGYPDFPECPFGQSFSMLGFDTAEQTYVWLATDILRDNRLVRVPYRSADIPDNA